MPQQALALTAPTPNALQQPILLRQPIERIVPFAHSTHKPTEGVDLIIASISPGLVHFANRDLYAGVIFGFDDPVGGGAFAGDVPVGRRGLLEQVRGNRGRGDYKSTSSPFSFSMMELVEVGW